MRPPTKRRTFLKGAGIVAGLPFLTGTGTAENSCRMERHRPGPDPLYEQPVTAPQFETPGAWNADPILVSGTDAYVDGEYLYQGFVYDDFGAATSPTRTPPDPQPDEHNTGPMSGDIVYPTNVDRYAHNAADILEFRVQPRGDGLLYRFTLNTMQEPDVTGIAVGIDTGDGGRTDWGYGLGDLGAEAEHVLVTWGSDAELDGKSVSTSVDLERNQIEVEVPFDPDDETWRHYMVAGLFDTEAREFKEIQEQPTEEQPGGARGQNPPPVFNVGFRFNDEEPMGSGSTSFARLEDGRPVVEPDRAQEQPEHLTETESRAAGYGYWRDHAQAKALADRDISQFYADIDFGRLRDKETEYHVPETGYINRLYASNYDLGAGIDPDTNLIVGNVQPYSVYIPSSYDPDEPTAMHLNLHSLTSTYNQYQTTMPRMLQQLGEERDALVVGPHARGPAHWYAGAAELDVFEAWGDAAHHYNIDFDRVTIGGYSMGGHGTYKLASQYPDLFARAFAIVGPPDREIEGGPSQGVAGSEQNMMRLTDNLRTVPILMWASMLDELVPYPGVLGYQQQLEEHGYRHRLDSFPTYDHVLPAVEDEWGPGKEFLGDATVERAPRRVTFRRAVDLEDEALDLVHDGAHWVSEIEVAEDADDGLVDAISEAQSGVPETTQFETVGVQPVPHQRRGVKWTDANVQPPTRNALSVTLEDVTGVTLWVDTAGLDTSRPIEVTIETDRPATVRLAAENGSTKLDVDSGESTHTVRLRGHGEVCST